MKATRCYLVSVRTTNANKNTVQFADGRLFSCTDGKLYVTTEDPRHIYEAIGEERVVAIENIGIGYHMTTAEALGHDVEKSAFLRKVMD